MVLYGWLEAAMSSRGCRRRDPKLDGRNHIFVQAVSHGVMPRYYSAHTQENFTVYGRPARRRLLSQDLRRYEAKRSWWPGTGALETKRVKARTTRGRGVPSPMTPGKSFVFTPCHQQPDIIIANVTMFMLDRVGTRIFCFSPSVCQKLPSTTKPEEGTTV